MSKRAKKEYINTTVKFDSSSNIEKKAYRYLVSYKGRLAYAQIIAIGIELIRHFKVDLENPDIINQLPLVDDVLVDIVVAKVIERLQKSKSNLCDGEPTGGLISEEESRIYPDPEDKDYATGYGDSSWGPEHVDHDTGYEEPIEDPYNEYDVYRNSSEYQISQLIDHDSENWYQQINSMSQNYDTL